MTTVTQLMTCMASAWLAGSAAAEPTSLAAYMTLSGPEPTAHITYGIAPSQYVEFFAPQGHGPFPVAVLIHGGCWQKKYGGILQMRNVAVALAAQGVAVWNVEYRRVDEDGGGYPGTFLDINAALEQLAANAHRYNFDTERLVVVGHSAGGHLAQWLAGRGRIPPSSPLFVAHFLPARQIIALGSLGDLRDVTDADNRVCGIDVAQLVGRPSAGRPDVYADTNPADLMPNGSHTVLINGELDSVSSPETAARYANLARKAGDAIDTLTLPGASHYDEVVAASPSWQLIHPVIRAALAKKTPVNP